jgi:hypothetical protein
METLRTSFAMSNMVFNRRRRGEISRTLLDDYKNKKKVNPEHYEFLNRLEIICADLFTMIYAYQG